LRTILPASVFERLHPLRQLEHAQAKVIPESDIVVSPDTRQVDLNSRSFAVSLIATSFNEEDTVADWLEALSGFDFLPDEIVLCDGGSTDRTCARIHEWLRARAPEGLLSPTCRVIFLEGQKLNIAQGRNCAVRASKGDVLAFTDLGAEPKADWLRKVVAPFQLDDKLQFVMGWYEVETSSELARGVSTILVPRLENINPSTFLPSARSFAIRRPLFLQLGGYPEYLTRAGEDTLFDVSLKKTRARGAFVPEAVVAWSFPNSLSSIFRKIYDYSLGDGEAKELFLDLYVQRLREVLCLVFDLTLLLLSIVVCFYAPSFLTILIVILLLTNSLISVDRTLRPLVNHLRVVGGVSDRSALVGATLIAFAQAFGFLRGWMGKSEKGLN